MIWEDEWEEEEGLKIRGSGRTMGAEFLSMLEEVLAKEWRLSGKE